MFFYLYLGQGFICFYRGQMKRCLISWSLCGNPEDNFGQHKKLWNGRPSLRWEWLLAKVGVAPLRPTIVMGNISPRCCPNPLRFLVFHF